MTGLLEKAYPHDECKDFRMSFGKCVCIVCGLTLGEKAVTKGEDKAAKKSENKSRSMEEK